MRVNKKLQTALADLGLEASIENNVSVIRGTLNSVLQASEELERLPWDSKSNRERATHDLKDRSSDGVRFRGGHYKQLQDDLNGLVDMGPFDRERRKLVESGLLGKLQTATEETTPRRKRRMSEHDGELDLARIYEIQPFYATHKVRSEERSIEIVANFSISAYANAEEIDAYGALVWALADIIENAGIRTRVVYRQRGRGIDKDTRTLGMLQEFVLKEPWEYLPPSLLAATFTTRFYRRMSFAFIPLLADMACKTVFDSLGNAIAETSPIVFTDGKLILGPDAKAGMTDQIREQVMAAIGLKQGETV